MDKVGLTGNAALQQYAEQLLRQPAAEKSQRPEIAAMQDSAQLHDKQLLANHVMYRSIEKHTLAVAENGLQLDKPEASSLFDAEEVARNVLNFVAGAMYKAKEGGMSDEKLQEMMLQARAGIDMGFDEARSELSDSGIMNDELEKGINTSYDLIQNGLEDIESGDYKIQSSPVTTLQQMNMQQSQSGHLELETAEGDMVSISFGSQSMAAMESGENDQGRYLKAQFSSEQSFSFSVQGDLNESELQAIADLIKQVDKVGNDFFNGDLDQAFERAGDIGFDDEQLVGFALNYEQRQQVSVEAYQQQAASDSPLSKLVPDLNKFISDWQQLQDKVRTLFAEPEAARNNLLDLVLPLSANRAESQQTEDNPPLELAEPEAMASSPAVERFNGFAAHMEELLNRFA